MVCKIQKPNAATAAAVEYNERKTRNKEGEDLETGRVVATWNVPEGSTFEEELKRLADLAEKTGHTGPKIKNTNFHMSINPGPDDPPMDDLKAAEFAEDLMKELGYTGQPMRLYRHTDIDREHFHLVTTRIGQDGKKINDSYERRRIKEAMIKLAPKYGFTVPTGKEEKNDKKEQNRKGTKKKQTQTDPRFIRNKKEGNAYVPVETQIVQALEACLQWSYTTPEQLQALLLRRYNVLMDIEKKNSDEQRVILAGTSNSGKVLTKLLREEDLDSDIVRRLIEKCHTTDMSPKRDQRRRVESVLAGAASLASSWDEFTELAGKKGVLVAVSFDKEDRPFGVTYIDKATKCIWKGSETRTDFEWLRTTATEKGWNITKDVFQKALEARAKMPSRRGAMEKLSQDTETKRRQAQKPSIPSFKKTGGVSRGEGSTLRKEKPDELAEKLKRENEERLARAEASASQDM